MPGTRANKKDIKQAFGEMIQPSVPDAQVRSPLYLPLFLFRRIRWSIEKKNKSKKYERRYHSAVICRQCFAIEAYEYQHKRLARATGTTVTDFHFSLLCTNTNTAAVNNVSNIHMDSLLFASANNDSN